MQSLVTTGVCDAGFLLDGAGGIVCTGAAEILKDVDEEGDLPAALDKQFSHGHHAKTRSTWYGAECREEQEYTPGCLGLYPYPYPQNTLPLAMGVGRGGGVPIPKGTIGVWAEIGSMVMSLATKNCKICFSMIRVQFLGVTEYILIKKDKVIKYSES